MSKPKFCVMDLGIFHHTPLILRPWEKNIQPLELKSQKQPIWVLKKMPLELMTPTSLSYVASGLDNPICLDKATKSVNPLGVARVCVELQLDENLITAISVMMENGSTIDVYVEYPWKALPKPLAKKWIVKNSVQGDAPS